VILSTRTTLKFSNNKKLDNLRLFVEEYKKVCQFFIDEFWLMDKVPLFGFKDITSKVTTWLSARAIQCAAKQASGIVRGTKKKLSQRMYVYEKFIKDNLFHQAQKLKKIIDKEPISKPNIEKNQPELDSRFVKIDLENKTSFDGWLNLTCLGNKLKIKIPFKKTKHFNEMLSQGKIKTGVRINDKSITFLFDIPEVEIKTEGTVLGLDIGIKNVFTTSDNQKSVQDKHGWDLTKIQQRLSRRVKGGYGFEKSQIHRKNYVNWSLNQLNLTDVKQLRIENIKNMRKGNKSSRWMSHWTYTLLFDKLNLLCSKLGVQVCKVNPTYTSQRCSQCGWVRKSNRKGKQFKCSQCNFTCDSDLNASKNIALELPSVGRQQRLQKKNRKGFYWNSVDQERIVPANQKV
jgi:IS605 OrfB family transposase